MNTNELGMVLAAIAVAVGLLAMALHRYNDIERLDNVRPLMHSPEQDGPSADAAPPT